MSISLLADNWRQPVNRKCILIARPVYQIFKQSNFYLVIEGNFNPIYYSANTIWIKMNLNSDNFEVCRICLLEPESNRHIAFLPIFGVLPEIVNGVDSQTSELFKTLQDCFGIEVCILLNNINN